MAILTDGCWSCTIVHYTYGTGHVRWCSSLQFTRRHRHRSCSLPLSHFPLFTSKWSFRGYERPDCLRKCVPSGILFRKWVKVQICWQHPSRSIRRIFNVRCWAACFQCEKWNPAIASFFPFHQQWPCDSENEWTIALSSFRLHQPINENLFGSVNLDLDISELVCTCLHAFTRSDLFSCKRQWKVNVISFIFSLH